MMSARTGHPHPNSERKPAPPGESRSPGGISTNHLIDLAQRADIATSASSADVRPSASPPVSLWDSAAILASRRTLGSIEVQTTPLTAQIRADELWPKKLHHHAAIVAKLRESSNPELAEQISQCHTEHHVAQCDRCGATRGFWNRCKKVWCPICQAGIAKRRQAELAFYTLSINQPKHVVLTVKNTTDLTRGHVQEFRKWFKGLLRRNFCKKFTRVHIASNVKTRRPIYDESHPWSGGCYSIEVTKEKHGWHLHVHILTNSPFISQRRLSEEWSKCNRGAGYIVKVKDVRGTEYLREVSKYAVKGNALAAWQPEEIVEFVQAFNKVRTFGVFGDLFGIRSKWKAWLEEHKSKGNACACGCEDWTIYTDADWAIHQRRLAILKGAPPTAPPITA